jgi:hypothetical protein
MLVRTVLTLVNFTIFGIVIAVVLLYPGLDAIAFYFLLGWMIASFALLYMPFANRRIGGSAPPTDTETNPFLAGTGPASPLPSSPPVSTLGFCIYCAAPLPVGASVCPACGHAVPHF